MVGRECGECGKPIPEDAKFAINAFQKVWHKECFNCAQCGERVFSFGKFFDNGEGKPKCAMCYKKKAPTCAACNKSVEGEFREASGKSYHVDCFRCAGCSKVIGKEGAFEDNGKLWHLECAQDSETQ